MEVLGVDGGTIRTQEVFIYEQQGLDADGKIRGQHAYIAESQFLDKFYRVGALKPPAEHHR